MVDKDNRKPKSKGGSLRTKALAALLALVALVAVWLSDCIPGFGFGSEGAKDGEAEQQGENAEPATPAEPEPDVAAEPAAEPTPMKLTIDARGCLVDGGEAQDCATLCEQDELFAGVKAVTIDAKQGPHGVVVEVLDCLATRQLDVSITRK